MAGAIGRSGGTRVGAGRPRKSDKQRWLGGDAGKRSHTEKPQLHPVELISAPEGLSEDEIAVWNTEAPFACQARTLTKATVGAFVEFCEAVVMARSLKKRILDEGLTYLKVTVDGAGQEHREQKRHSLLPELRGWAQTVRTKRAEFKLSPMGKPIEEAVVVEDPFSEFDATVN